MKLLLLGTGAADGIPAFHGNCRVCRYAREHGGKDVRTRAAALLDGVIKLDLGPDTLAQMHRERLTASDWSAVVFTHSDDDHLAPEYLQYALYPFTDMDHMAFTIYGNATVVKRLRRQYPDWPMEIVVTRSFCPFSHAGYDILPVKAKHMCGEDAHNLVIRRDGRTLIYATDTGVWDPPSWEALRGSEADLLVIECTDGFKPAEYDGHLGVETCVEVVNRLRKFRALKDGARVVTTHHSHRGNATHAELEEALAPHGIEPGYDGLVLEI